MKNKYFTIAALVFLITGCSANKLLNKPVIKAKKLDNNSVYVVPTDATLKTNIIRIKNDGSFQMLSEVSPDAIVASVVNLTTKLNLKLKSGDSLSAEQLTTITQSVVQLGKRTVAVNVLRDALFRLEEFNQNRDPNKMMDTSTYNIFMEVLKNVTEISKAEQKDAEKEIKKSEEIISRQQTKQLNMIEISKNQKEISLEKENNKSSSEKRNSGKIILEDLHTLIQDLINTMIDK